VVWCDVRLCCVMLSKMDWFCVLLKKGDKNIQTGIFNQINPGSTHGTKKTIITNRKIKL
jgi:hypothetical protein